MTQDAPWHVSDDAELESGVDYPATLLSTYNRHLGTWPQPRTGEFWDVVRDTHRRDLTGQGVTVAVIDGGFDTSIPALSAAHPHGDDPLHTAHGSVVALLVTSISLPTPSPTR